MKSTPTAFYRSKIVLSLFLIMTASGFIRAHAQAIVGKWEAVSSTSYLTPEAAKETGSSKIVSASGSQAGKATSEYRADHGYTMSVTPPGSEEALIMKGKWALTGDQLKITMDSPGNPSSVITVVITGNTMVASTKMAYPSKTTKVETTFRKIN